MSDLDEKEAEIPAKLIAAFTSMSSGNLSEAVEIFQEAKELPEAAADYLFGLMLGMIEFTSMRLGVEADEIIQVIALRNHLLNEGVALEDLPSPVIGSLPSEEAEKLLASSESTFQKIQKTVSKSLRDSAAMPTDESDVYRGEALTAIGKLAHSMKAKLET